MIITSPLRVPGLKTTVAYPVSFSVTMRAGRPLPYVLLLTAKSTATPATGALLLSVTHAVTVAVPPPPAVTHAVSVPTSI
ncbi:MAG: hypothetical protein LLF90_01215 [Methanomicrobiaceae archaeon]|nr:hypothetical protein [Methanomicrobiaceae archaeon]